MDALTWLKLMNEKKDKIYDAAMKAYKEAIDSPQLRFIVEMDEDDIYTWCDVAGGNSFHGSTFRGNSLELMVFCFQYMDYPISDDKISAEMERREMKKQLTLLEQEKLDDCASLESLISYNHPELSNILETCIQDEKDYLVENCLEVIEQRYNYLVRELKRYAELEEVIA